MGFAGDKLYSLSTANRRCIYLSIVLSVLIITALGCGIRSNIVASTVKTNNQYESLCAFQFYQGTKGFVLVGTIPDLIVLLLATLAFIKLDTETLSEIARPYFTLTTLCFTKNVACFIVLNFLWMGRDFSCSEPNETTPPYIDPNINVAKSQFDAYYIISGLVFPLQLAISIIGCCAGKNRVPNKGAYTKVNNTTVNATKTAAVTPFGATPHSVPPSA